MEENRVFQLAVETSEKIKSVFGNRITEPKIVDVVEYGPYQRFGIRFVAYDYFLILFNYDRGFCVFGFNRWAIWSLFRREARARRLQ